MKPDVHVDIVVGVLERHGKILMLHRRDADPMWDKKWEFPGGKIELGEDTETAMMREIEEETGLIATSLEFIGVHHHVWEQPHRNLHVKIHCFHGQMPDGDVLLEEGKTYGHVWETYDRALEYDCLDANADILKKLCETKNLGGNQ